MNQLQRQALGRVALSAITFWGLRTVKPLMEQVVKMLSEHQTKSGGEMPESVNEERNRLEADE